MDISQQDSKVIKNQGVLVGPGHTDVWVESDERASEYSKPRRVAVTGSVRMGMAFAAVAMASNPISLFDSWFAEDYYSFQSRHNFARVEAGKRIPPKHANCSRRHRGRKFRGS